MSRDFKGKKSIPVKKGKTNYKDKKSLSKQEGENISSQPFNDEKEFKSKKFRSGKSSTKSSFERYRDDSRPSDFGISKKRNFSDYGEIRNENSFDKPDFKKKTNDGKPIFKKRFTEDNSERIDKSSKVFIKTKSIVNPNDLDESDFDYNKSAPTFGALRKGSYIKKPYVKKTYTGKKQSSSNPQRKEEDGLIRLNKYIANAGISSRREADDLISSGVVQVNGKTITEMGYRVKPTDIIKYGGQLLKKERMVYFILNKPKDYITTSDDPQKRKTVFELMKGACKERIYPVGRLDRATTGLLMFTNDGDLTKKLTHPKYGVRKIYHVETDKPLKMIDMGKIKEGLELEDGQIKVDEITFVGNGSDKTQIGVELHSGKNRIVRRIFESLGYNVRKLDRVMFGSITKKDLPRGRWRILAESEVGMLKMISAD